MVSTTIFMTSRLPLNNCYNGLVRGSDQFADKKTPGFSPPADDSPYVLAPIATIYLSASQARILNL